MTYNQAITSTPAVLVEFYASWCPHCQRMMPVVEQIKILLDGSADVYQFEIDENRELADAQKVESIPTFIVYKDGKEMWRRSGEIDADVLLSEVRRYI
ncbi:MAG: thioredoxin family protein [Bacteroides sp.]|nr:thioredoxin family protein [Bacteroides sp.]MCM1457720.1 thioredoxin family protein [Lachnoclostridium sp.]